MKKNLITSNTGIDFIKEFEGEVLKVYLDPVGLPTLGVGHLLTSEEKRIYKVGQIITAEESTRFLRQDLRIAENAINNSVKIALNQNQFDALVSLVFNIGIRGFAKSSVLRMLNAGKPIDASNAFLLWNKAGGNIVAGLVRRRKAERALFLKAAAFDSAGTIAANTAGDTKEPDTKASALKDLGNTVFMHCPKDSVKNIFVVIGTRVLTGVLTVWSLGLHGQIFLIVAALIFFGAFGYALFKYSDRAISGAKRIVEYLF